MQHVTFAPRGDTYCKVWNLRVTDDHFKGVLDNYPSYFFNHPIIIKNFNIFILKSPYINYNPLFEIIAYLILYLRWLFE